MRRAVRDTTTACLLAVLALLSSARPALAQGDAHVEWVTLPPAQEVFAVADGTPVAAEGDIEETEPHVGGYTSNGSRLNARPGALGVQAYDQVPARVDLRPYAPAVGDQGSVGACVPWTLTRSIMGYYANRTGAVDTPYAPLFSYMRNVAAGGAPNSGTNPDRVLASLQAGGVDSQDDYFQGTSNYKVAPTPAQIANAQNYKITGYTRLWSGANQGPNAKTMIMAALANNMPVAVGFPVFRDFMSLGAHSLYTTTSGTNLGGHMVTAFGYDADGVYLRNQWGTGWGNSGDAHVSWDFVTTTMTGAYTISGISTPDSPARIAPQVTQMSVSKGAAGTPVTLVGANLSTVTSVTFGGRSAQFTRTTTNGVTRLVANAPANSGGRVDVAVTNTAGTSPDTDADDFTYPSPIPTVSALTPNSGGTAGGTTVRLTGADLGAATSVKVGTATVTPTTVTDDSLTFVTPARAAGAVTVTVTTPGGTSSASAAGARFTYVAPGTPAVTGVSPSSGQAGQTTQVLITGSNLGDASAVTVGDVSVGFARVSATQIRVNLPARAAGAVDIRVTTPGGVSVAGPASRFTYVATPVPTVSMLSPSSGVTTATTTVVVTGTGLSDVTKVTLGGVAMSYTMVDATTLKVFVKGRPAGAASLVVTTRGGSSAGVRFTLSAPARPVIGSLSPAVGQTTASTTITVNGSGFTGATRVSLGGRATKFTWVSATRLTFIAPTGRAGVFPVLVVGPGGTSVKKNFTYKSTIVPELTSVSPNTGPTTANTKATLTGRYLTGASLVTANGKRVSFKRVSDSEISITLVRRAAGPVTIKVKTRGGTSNGLVFRYAVPAAPVVTGLSVTSGPAGESGTITVTGRNLTGVTRVTLGGTGVAFKVGTSSRLTVILPAKPVGQYDLVITTPAGRSTVTSASRYTYY